MCLSDCKAMFLHAADRRRFNALRLLGCLTWTNLIVQVNQNDCSCGFTPSQTSCKKLIVVCEADTHEGSITYTCEGICHQSWMSRQPTSR